MGMVAHILFEAWDAQRPSSLSPTIIQGIIRERIGFDGFLMSDDIGMEALAGTAGERAAATVAAGCDAALHCSGKLDEMIDVAEHVPEMSADGQARLAQAMSGTLVDQDGPSLADATAKRDALLALV